MDLGVRPGLVGKCLPLSYYTVEQNFHRNYKESHGIPSRVERESLERRLRIWSWVCNEYFSTFRTNSEHKYVQYPKVTSQDE